MLTRLRRQLTLLSAACTGAVLLAMALAALSLAEGQLRAGSEAGFLSSANAIIAKLRSDRVVSTTWLAQLESGEGLIISLRDQGAPLSFSGAWTPRTARPLLLERAVAGARALGVEPDSPPLSLIDTTSTPVFEVRGDLGERYLASVTQIPSSQGWQSLVLLKDMSSSDQQLLLLRGSFAALVAAGVTALLLLCWAFAGRAIRPIEESRRKQAEFIAAASHELRSPLALITGYAEMVRDITWKDEAMRSENLNLIISESNRMSEMVTDILDYSQFSAGYSKLKKDWYDLKDIVNAELTRCRQAAAEHHITLTLQAPEAELNFEVDALKMSQVMRNLLNNAINHTPENREIFIRLVPKSQVPLSSPVTALQTGQDFCLVEVINPGEPIPEEDRKIIWERYQRSQHQSGRHLGTGIGLSIVSTILKAHDMPYGVNCKDGYNIFWFLCR